MKDFGLYIHIPFCESKCYYCDFNSYYNKIDLVERYITYVIKELSIYKEKLKNYNIKTIFIGGGTPSLIDPIYIEKLLKFIYENFNVNRLIEISIEGNPNSLSIDKLKKYKEIGINRLSIGLQSYDDVLLNKIGRVHKVSDFEESFNNARKLGFNNINVDVMFNLPNQTVENVIDTLDKVTYLNPEHISFYSLKLEEGTVFYNKYYDNSKELPSEENELKMYHDGIKFLKEKGYIQYEISNFSLNGYECKHNLLYWKVEPYLGVGLGAHSNLFEYRWGNKISFNDYFDSLDKSLEPVDEREKINKEVEMAECLILGLRLNEGIDINGFKKRFKKDVLDIYNDTINKFTKNNLMSINKNKLFLTQKGIDLSNIVFIEILP